MKLLAIDIGASSGRGIVGELNGEKLTLSEVHRFENHPVDIDGHKHWDLARLRGELLACLSQAPDAVSVGIDTWGVDYGYIGPDGEPIGTPFAYRDDRTIPMVDAVHGRIPFKRLYEITGIQFMRLNTIYQLADDVAHRSDLLERAERMLFMPDLLSYLLTGSPVTEYSIASTSELLDCRARDWSSEILEVLGYPRSLLGEVTPPGAHRAALRPDVAAQTGCHATVISPGGHDTASAVVAAPLAGDDAMYISSGTWSLAGMELDEPILTPEAREANFTNEGGVGGRIRFLKNVMGLWLIQELQRLWAAEENALTFAEICEEAEKAPAFVSLFDANHESLLAPEDMRSAIQALCRTTGEPVPEGVGPLARSVFESLALAYRQCLEQIQRLTGRVVDRIHVVGGGVQNKLLCRMTADACGVPVYGGPVEATAIGNLLVQAIALDAVPDIASARQIVRANFPLEEYAPQDQAAWGRAWERLKAVNG
jgi:rhamnulokinase